MRAARIVDNLVVDLWEVSSLDDYAEHVLVVAPEEVRMGWGYEGSVFINLKPAYEIENEAKLELSAMSLEYLKSTDWYVTRRSDTGVAIPADVDTARAEARLAIVEGV